MLDDPCPANAEYIEVRDKKETKTVGGAEAVDLAPCHQSQLLVKQMPRIQREVF